MLNKNTNSNTYNNIQKNQYITEGFENQIDNYDVFDNSFFDLSVTPWTNINLEEALQKCYATPSCVGITRKKKSVNPNESASDDTENNETYPILKLEKCNTVFMGSPLEKSKAQYYKSYIKKSSANKNICLNENTIKNYFSFTNKANLHWCLNDTDKSIRLLSAPRIRQANILSKAHFKIVTGLFSNDSISIQVSKTTNDTESESTEPLYYVYHDFPKQEKLLVTEMIENDTALKKKASFKMVHGLTKEGFSLKLIGLPDYYVKNVNNELMVGTINAAEKEDATFYTISPIEEQSYDNKESEETENENATIDLSPQEKFLKMKNKNLLSLEKQQLMIEEQNKKIKNYQFVHFGNIGRISREFANQSAELALSKYLKEKESIDEIANKNKNKSIDNTPSVTNLK